MSKRRSSCNARYVDSYGISSRCVNYAKTMRSLTQARFQCDADLAGNLDNSHSTSAHIGYLGYHSVVSFTSKTQGSLSTSTAESETVNQCLKEEALAIRGMLILMGFPQDATINRRR